VVGFTITETKYSSFQHQVEKLYMHIKQSSQITRDFRHSFQLICICFSVHNFYLKDKYILTKTNQTFIVRDKTNRKATSFGKHNFQQNCCRQIFHDEPVHNQLQSLREKKQETMDPKNAFVLHHNRCPYWLVECKRWNSWQKIPDAFSHNNVMKLKFRVKVFKKLSCPLIGSNLYLHSK